MMNQHDIELLGPDSCSSAVNASLLSKRSQKHILLKSAYGRQQIVFDISDTREAILTFSGFFVAHADLESQIALFFLHVARFYPITEVREAFNKYYNIRDPLGARVIVSDRSRGKNPCGGFSGKITSINIIIFGSH